MAKSVSSGVTSLGLSTESGIQGNILWSIVNLLESVVVSDESGISARQVDLLGRLGKVLPARSLDGRCLGIWSVKIDTMR